MDHVTIKTSDNKKSQTPNQGFEIHIKENLSPNWMNWFDDYALTVTPNGESILAGAITDQSALHGLLAKIRDLNLTLISVNPIEPKETKP